jgi:hypothetical protein
MAAMSGLERQHSAMRSACQLSPTGRSRTSEPDPETAVRESTNRPFRFPIRPLALRGYSGLMQNKPPLSCFGYAAGLRILN